MKNDSKVAVCSRSFSRNPILREELLSRYSNVKFNDNGLSLAGDELVAFLKGYEKAITALEIINFDVLSQLSDLKVIAKYGVGLDMIDMAAMRKFGKRLGWQGGVNRRSVAELTIALMISLLRHLPEANYLVKNGGWRQLVGRQLTGRTIGVIGCGNVGKDLVKLLRPYGCRVLVFDILQYEDFYLANKIEAVELPRLLSESDIVTLHVPLTEETRNIIDGKNISMLKPDVILINTARGGLVDEVALKKMLQKNKFASAAFDVFLDEPPSDTELLKLPNFFCTPHIGGSSEEAILAMGLAAINGLEVNSIPRPD